MLSRLDDAMAEDRQDSNRRDEIEQLWSVLNERWATVPANDVDDTNVPLGSPRSRLVFDKAMGSSWARRLQ